jgi:hypothetical protein
MALKKQRYTHNTVGLVQGDKGAYRQHGREITVTYLKINNQCEALVCLKYELRTKVF